MKHLEQTELKRMSNADLLEENFVVVSASSSNDSDIVTVTKEDFVTFVSIQRCLIAQQYLCVEYCVGRNIHVSCNDKIGIFKSGWNKINECADFSYASDQPINTDFPCRQRCIFDHERINHMNGVFQFVYIGEENNVLGVSKLVWIDMTNKYFEGKTPPDKLCSVELLPNMHSNDTTKYLCCHNEGDNTDLLNDSLSFEKLSYSEDISDEDSFVSMFPLTYETRTDLGDMSNCRIHRSNEMSNDLSLCNLLCVAANSFELVQYDASNFSRSNGHDVIEKIHQRNTGSALLQEERNVRQIQGSASNVGFPFVDMYFLSLNNYTFLINNIGSDIYTLSTHDNSIKKTILFNCDIRQKSSTTIHDVCNILARQGWLFLYSRSSNANHFVDSFDISVTTVKPHFRINSVSYLQYTGFQRAAIFFESWNSLRRMKFMVHLQSNVGYNICKKMGFYAVCTLKLAKLICILLRKRDYAFFLKLLTYAVIKRSTNKRTKLFVNINKSSIWCSFVKQVSYRKRQYYSDQAVISTKRRRISQPIVFKVDVMTSNDETAYANKRSAERNKKVITARFSSTCRYSEPRYTNNNVVESVSKSSNDEKNSGQWQRVKSKRENLSILMMQKNKMEDENLRNKLKQNEKRIPILENRISALRNILFCKYKEHARLENKIAVIKENFLQILDKNTANPWKSMISCKKHEKALPLMKHESDWLTVSLSNNVDIAETIIDSSFEPKQAYNCQTKHDVGSVNDYALNLPQAAMFQLQSKTCDVTSSNSNYECNKTTESQRQCHVFEKTLERLDKTKSPFHIIDVTQATHRPLPVTSSNTDSLRTDGIIKCGKVLCSNNDNETSYLSSSSRQCEYYTAALINSHSQCGYCTAAPINSHSQCEYYIAAPINSHSQCENVHVNNNILGKNNHRNDRSIINKNVKKATVYLSNGKYLCRNTQALREDIKENNVDSVEMVAVCNNSTRKHTHRASSTLHSAKSCFKNNISTPFLSLTSNSCGGSQHFDVSRNLQSVSRAKTIQIKSWNGSLTQKYCRCKPCTRQLESENKYEKNAMHSYHYNSYLTGISSCQDNEGTSYCVHFR